MGDSKRVTHVRRRDGLLGGDTVGHADSRNRIRRRDGVLFRGEEMGYVDDEGNIRERDGFIFRGDVVGKIKDDAAHDVDGFIFEGEKWGYVDDSGNIRQRDGFIFRGRIIGHMKGNNKAGALGYYVLRFRDIEKQVKQLEQDVRSAQHKARYLNRVSKLLEWVPNAEALGDFDDVIRRLQSLKSTITTEIDQNRSNKLAICIRAEALCESPKGNSAKEAMQTLMMNWKRIGPAGQKADDELWRRFSNARERFYSIRRENVEKMKSEFANNKSKKESLCARAESLKDSSSWKEAGEKLKVLQAEWKTIRSAGREHDDPLWNRFRGALNHFYDNRKRYFESRDREQTTNLHKKERMCSEAESLVHSSNMKEAKQRIKDLQAEWKTVGHVPKECNESLWSRFRHACDMVFETAAREAEQRKEEWYDKIREALARKSEQIQRLRESIDHDEGNISRWQDTICNLHDGGRADEIRYALEEKINDVHNRIRSKERRLEELEDAIRDIESKLR